MPWARREIIQMALWLACGYVNFERLEFGFRGHLFALCANSKAVEKKSGRFKPQSPKIADRNLHMSLLTTFVGIDCQRRVKPFALARSMTPSFQSICQLVNGCPRLANNRGDPFAP